MFSDAGYRFLTLFVFFKEDELYLKEGAYIFGSKQQAQLSCFFMEEHGQEAFSPFLSSVNFYKFTYRL